MLIIKECVFNCNPRRYNRNNPAAKQIVGQRLPDGDSAALHFLLVVRLEEMEAAPLVNAAASEAERWVME